MLIENPENLKRHVVILGAGASVAGFPNGDANGKKLPIMNNMIDVLNLGPVLEQAGVEYMGRNFEAVYSELHKNDPKAPLINKIETSVYAYFDSLRLPDSPTLYDHLLISLRPKDIIATFNWDPFLFDAYKRNSDKVPLPSIINLHGNVRIGYCLEHNVFDENGTLCPECNKELTSLPLLYPINIKKYADNPFIADEWNLIKTGLDEAVTLTIFGYSAPDTDKEAINIMMSAWRKDKRLIERIEVIDIKNKSELEKQWKPFTVRNYFDHYQDFYKSRIASFPRRTCEALHASSRYGFCVEKNPLPKDFMFDELIEWVEPLVNAEEKLARKKKY